MNRLFLMYPTGRAGAALLLQRLSAAFLLIAGIVSLAGLATWATVALATVAVLLLIGLLTPFAALASAILALVACPRLDGVLAMVVALHILNMLALAMLGAGAYSMDAYLFGRRVITLDD